MNCSTLTEAMQIMVDYQSLISEGGRLSVERGHNDVRIIYRPGVFQVPMTRFQVECIFSGIVTFVRWLLHQNFSPIDVSFTHALNHSISEYERVFNCPVAFGRSDNSIRLSMGILEEKIPYADPELKMHHLEIADKFMNFRQADHKIVTELTGWLKSLDVNEKVSLDATASFLNISPRTLQRKLKNLQTSYNEIFNSVIMGKAHDLLLSTDLSMPAVSEKLGYLNASSFHRRFKDWFGITPHEYRVKGRRKK
jgi:AraC-like DNA-binding protein